MLAQCGTHYVHTMYLLVLVEVSILGLSSSLEVSFRVSTHIWYYVHMEHLLSMYLWCILLVHTCIHIDYPMYTVHV
jgi:hypothetical protein